MRMKNVNIIQIVNNRIIHTRKNATQFKFLRPDCDTEKIIIINSNRQKKCDQESTERESHSCSLTTCLFTKYCLSINANITQCVSGIKVLELCLEFRSSLYQVSPSVTTGRNLCCIYTNMCRHGSDLDIRIFLYLSM